MQCTITGSFDERARTVAEWHVEVARVSFRETIHNPLRMQCSAPVRRLHISRSRIDCLSGFLWMRPPRYAAPWRAPGWRAMYARSKCISTVEYVTATASALACRGGGATELAPVQYMVIDAFVCAIVNVQPATIRGDRRGLSCLPPLPRLVAERCSFLGLEPRPGLRP